MIYYSIPNYFALIICYILYVALSFLHHASIFYTCYILYLPMALSYCFSPINFYMASILGSLGSVFVQFGPVYPLKTSPGEPPLERLNVCAPFKRHECGRS